MISLAHGLASAPNENGSSTPLSIHTSPKPIQKGNHTYTHTHRQQFLMHSTRLQERMGIGWSGIPIRMRCALIRPGEWPIGCVVEERPSAYGVSLDSMCTLDVTPAKGDHPRGMSLEMRLLRTKSADNGGRVAFDCLLWDAGGSCTSRPASVGLSQRAHPLRSRSSRGGDGGRRLPVGEGVIGSGEVAGGSGLVPAR